MIEISLLLLIGALAYWIHQARKQAAENLRVFEKTPQSPADHDLYYITQIMNDTKKELEWRKQVAANEERREREKKQQVNRSFAESDKSQRSNVSMLIRRQAD